MTILRRLGLALLLIVVSLLAVDLLTPLPSLEHRIASEALIDTANTRLGRAVAAQVAAHPGVSGIHALPNAEDAFLVRLLLARRAERSLDIQYYIWNDDLTGRLLYEALHDAAERGVRVRLLLDDNRTEGKDELLAALDAHPNIQVRLFNPFVLRDFRILGYLTDFLRLNRRMHNKSFTADNQVTIIGGRNIGDEYFEATQDGELTFTDLDVLAVGPVVRRVSGDFDRYWASRSAYPAERLLPTPSPGALARLSTVERAPRAVAYLDALESSPLAATLERGAPDFEWAPTRMVSDDPAKGLGLAASETLFPQLLSEAIGTPQAELDVVSPYFVPTAAGVEAFSALAERGVRVRILVNSLEATDVVAVHSGYAKRRKPLLEAGIRLFEMRLVSEVPGSRGNGSGTGRWGSSATSLHAKTMAVDRSRIFIGSFNLDPRSARLNTELGFVIESPALAGRLAELFDTHIPEVAYEVRLSDDGELYWLERQDGREIEHRTEPGAGFWRRATVEVLSWLPIEWLL